MNFDRAEILSRVDRLRTELKALNLDGMLIDDCEIAAYYFNDEPPLNTYRAGFIGAEGEDFFVLRLLDLGTMQERSWVRDLVGFTDRDDPVAKFAEKIRETGFEQARIGIDFTSHALTLHTFNALKRALPDVEFVDVDALPWKLRKVKSDAEINKLRKASLIADQVLQELLTLAKPGFTGRQAAAMVVEGYVRHGGDPCRLGIITVSKGDASLHGGLYEGPLQEGDMLHVELIPHFQGYCARIMRSIIIGEIPSDLDIISRKMIELQDKQIAAMKLGALAKDVDHIMRQGALDAGIRDDYQNITGYTLGYYSRLPTRGSDFTWVLSPVSDWALEEGMVFHIYTSARGIAISETVLVGPNGGERLTRSPRKLFSSNDT